MSWNVDLLPSVPTSVISMNVDLSTRYLGIESGEPARRFGLAADQPISTHCAALQDAGASVAVLAFVV